jgi:hypothetical protein
MTDVSHLVLESFEPLVGEQFAINDGALQVRLTDADSLGDGPTAELRAPFSLIFRGPAVPALDQEIHRIDHASLGSMEIFLVPLGPDEAGEARYQAVFN